MSKWMNVGVGECMGEWVDEWVSEGVGEFSGEYVSEWVSESVTSILKATQSDKNKTFSKLKKLSRLWFYTLNFDIGSLNTHTLQFDAHVLHL